MVRLFVVHDEQLGVYCILFELMGSPGILVTDDLLLEIRTPLTSGPGDHKTTPSIYSKEFCMRVITMGLLALFAMGASAGEYTTFQKIIFQSASTFVPADKVCQSGKTLYHRSKKTIEVEYCNGGSNDRANCKVVSRPLVQPISSTRQRCSKMESDECVEWVTVPLVQGPTVKVKHYNSYNDMIDGQREVSESTVVLPKCTNK